MKAANLSLLVAIDFLNVSKLKLYRKYLFGYIKFKNFILDQKN